MTAQGEALPWNERVLTVTPGDNEVVFAPPSSFRVGGLIIGGAREGLLVKSLTIDDAEQIADQWVSAEVFLPHAFAVRLVMPPAQSRITLTLHNMTSVSFVVRVKVLP